MPWSKVYRRRLIPGKRNLEALLSREQVSDRGVGYIYRRKRNENCRLSKLE